MTSLSDSFSRMPQELLGEGLTSGRDEPKVNECVFCLYGVHTVAQPKIAVGRILVKGQLSVQSRLIAMQR